MYIGDGKLKPKIHYTVIIFGLRSRRFTEAFINGESAPVNYLVAVDPGLVLHNLDGPLYIGGYEELTSIKVCGLIFRFEILLVKLKFYN